MPIGASLSVLMALQLADRPGIRSFEIRHDRQRGFADKSPSWVLPWSGRLVSISERDLEG